MNFFNIILFVLFCENSLCYLNSTQSKNNGRLSMKQVSTLNSVEKIPRIIGGKPVKPGDFGYLALLMTVEYELNIGKCGGSIINQRFILTTAHCLEKIEAKRIKVAVGHGDPVNSAVVYDVQTKVEHNNYNKPPLHHNIALLYLKTPIKFNKYTYIVQVPGPDPPVDATCKIAGWGLLASDEKSRRHEIHWADLKVYDNKLCQDRFEFKIPFSEMMCAYSPDKRSCKGDSGSGLVWDGRVVGIMSISNNDKCDFSGYPQLFVRVSFYSNWIWGTVEILDGGRSSSRSTNLTVSIQLITFFVLLCTFL